MADAPAGSKDALKFLTRKIGPLPAWVWLAAFAGVWWYFQHKSGSGTSAPGTSATGYGTDPAGNTGYIDPETGYVYGSAEDIASLQQQGTVATNTDAGAGSSPGTPAGGYADDSAWASAAINYLVARGIDPTTANQAITLYLSGQNLTPEQQADINLAIQGIGAPPQLPGPASGNPPPIQQPPSGGGGGTGTGGGGGGGKGGTPPPAPTPKPKPKPKPPAPKPATPAGVAASNITSTGFTLHWNKVTGATSYRVRITYQDKLVKQVTSKSTSAAITGLTADHTYTVHVAAQTAAGLSAETNGPAVKTTR